MKISTQQLQKLLKNWEGNRVEFKARNSFSDDELFDYCAALANESGGYLIFGVNNQKELVGTTLFIGTLQKYPNRILNGIHVRVDTQELMEQGKRIVVFKVAGRPCGTPIQSCGKYKYPMRAGESLTEMDQETLRRIFAETIPDYTAEVIKQCTLNDLDRCAFKAFKEKWAQKSQRPEYLVFDMEKALQSVGVLVDKGLTRAALILFGTAEALAKWLPCAEIIFEWRQIPGKIVYDFRKEWRSGFFRNYDEIWESINTRNIRFPFQEGFIQREIYAFNEAVIREAVLNAVSHRDYRVSTASVFVRASPESFIVQSPGGFLPGITPENVINKQAWRNRLIAEVLQRAGIVERSGQGLDDIFRSSIQEGKGVPSFEGTDNHQVVLNVPAVIQDVSFVRYIEKIINETQQSLFFDELLELENIRKEQKLNKIKFKDKFLKLGFIEKVGHGRGTRYILSRRYYLQEQRVGVHTKLTGVSREQKKMLILNHIRKEGQGVSKDLQDALELNRVEVGNLLQELRRAGEIRHIGHFRWGYWMLKG